METRHHGHRVWFVYVAVAMGLLLATIAPLVRANGVAARVDHGIPLDIAAMTLRPTDLEAEGLVGHGISYSIMADRPRAIEQFVEDWGWDAAVADGTALREADADRTYLLNLSVDREIDGWIYSDHLVGSVIMEFEDAVAAEDGFAAAAAIWKAEDALEVVRSNVEFGDDQILFAGSGTKILSDDTYERSTLLYRTGNLVAVVSIHAYVGDAPAQEMMEALGERQLERIDTVLDQGGPGFSGQLLRLRLDGSMSNWDYYTVRDGEAIRLGSSFESEEEFAARNVDYEAGGVVDRYHMEQIVFDDPENYPDIFAFYASTITSHTDINAASRYMEEMRDEYGADETAEFVDVPALGDDVIAVTVDAVTPTGDTRERYRIFIRTGEVVIRLSHVTDTALAALHDLVLEPEQDFINEMAERQLACVEEEASCERAIRLPYELRPAEEQGNGTLGLLAIPLLPARRGVDRRMDMVATA